MATHTRKKNWVRHHKVDKETLEETIHKINIKRPSPSQHKCPSCGCTEYYYDKDSNEYYCCNIDCGAIW